MDTRKTGSATASAARTSPSSGRSQKGRPVPSAAFGAAGAAGAFAGGTLVGAGALTMPSSDPDAIDEHRREEEHEVDDRITEERTRPADARTRPEPVRPEREEKRAEEARRD